MTLGGRRALLGCAVAAAGVCLALGIGLPFMRLRQPAFHASGYSLLSAVDALARSGQLLLGTVVLIFSIFLPVLKLLYLVLLATLPLSEINRSASQLRALEWLGRWSLHDALAFALAAALVTGQRTLSERAASGAGFFAAAVLLMMLAYLWLRAEARASRMRAPALRMALAASRRGTAFGALVGLAAATFALGVVLPAVRLSTPYAGSDVHSIASLVLALYMRAEFPLWPVILTLAVLLPGLRLLYLLTLARARRLPHGIRAKAIAGAGVLGRYASADTMVLSLALLYLVAWGHAAAELQPGTYCLAASAFLTLIAYVWINVPVPAAPAQGSSLSARLAGLSSADTGP